MNHRDKRRIFTTLLRSGAIGEHDEATTKQLTKLVEVFRGTPSTKLGRRCADDESHLGLRYANRKCVECVTERKTARVNLARELDDERKRHENEVKRIRGNYDTMVVENELMNEVPDLILSRADALTGSLKVYRDGESCRWGHKSFRYVSTRNCIECHRNR
jgi:hypothetical protein